MELACDFLAMFNPEFSEIKKRLSSMKKINKKE